MGTHKNAPNLTLSTSASGHRIPQGAFSVATQSDSLECPFLSLSMLHQHRNTDENIEQLSREGQESNILASRPWKGP